MIFNLNIHSSSSLNDCEVTSSNLVHFQEFFSDETVTGLHSSYLMLYNLKTVLISKLEDYRVLEM